MGRRADRCGGWGEAGGAAREEQPQDNRESGGGEPGTSHILDISIYPAIGTHPSFGHSYGAASVKSLGCFAFCGA